MTAIATNEFFCHGRKVRQELRRRKDGDFGIFCQNEWLPLREPKEDDKDPTSISKELAHGMLAFFDRVDEKAVRHFFQGENNG